MKSLIVGYGEIGKALYNILSQYYPVDIVDQDYSLSATSGETEIMHICFPYSDKFKDEVRRYKKLFSPEYVVVHSTVPVGTCAELDVIHSPVIGIHPHLERSLKTFTKFLGGVDSDIVADYFRKAGIKVYIFDKSATTELMKILDTTFYGLCIEYTKMVREESWANKVPFEAWTIWTDAYNKGYKRLGYPEYQRPNLVPIWKVIGGHCVLNNCDFLENEFTEFLKNKYEGIKGEGDTKTDN